LPFEGREDRWLTYFDRQGWMARTERVTPEEYRFALEHARREYAAILQGFRLSPHADGALRELLALCRRQQVQAVLVLTPEAQDFQSWYASAARREIDGYVQRLAAETGVTVVDARNWVGDDDFADGHHVLPTGADCYSERLAREVLRPLVMAQ
jgi:hypothetical protein